MRDLGMYAVRLKIRLAKNNFHSIWMDLSYYGHKKFKLLIKDKRTSITQPTQQ